ncbi:phage tail fiber repeat protein, partial [Haemophilus influenzae]
RRPFKYRGK